MLKIFKKNKNIIFMLAIWFSLIWVKFSLAEDYLYENEFSVGYPESSTAQIIMSILNWAFFLIGVVGLIGFCVSIFLFVKDFFVKIFMKIKNHNN